jgi:hypothetical protein
MDGTDESTASDNTADAPVDPTELPTTDIGSGGEVVTTADNPSLASSDSQHNATADILGQLLNNATGAYATTVAAQGGAFRPRPAGGSMTQVFAGVPASTWLLIGGGAVLLLMLRR